MNLNVSTAGPRLVKQTKASGALGVSQGKCLLSHTFDSVSRITFGTAKKEESKDPALFDTV